MGGGCQSHREGDIHGGGETKLEGVDRSKGGG